MATTLVQFSDADASFLRDALHHLTGPLIVNARSLASHNGTTPGAIAKHVNRIKNKYNLEIACEGTRSPNKTSQKSPKKFMMGELSPDSNDSQLENILRKAIAAPPAAAGSTPCAATVNVDGSPMKRRRGVNAALPRRSKKTNHSPASTMKVEQTFGNDDILFDGGDSDHTDE